MQSKQLLLIRLNSVSFVNHQFHHAATQILVSIVNFPISPCGNSNPGHGTKFVTLPSSTLLCEYSIMAGSMYLLICFH